jgi:hypothetical protein
VVLLGLAIGGCKEEGKQEAEGRGETAGEVREPSTRQPIEEPSAGGAAERNDETASAKDALGVAECDAYVRQFSRCVETKIPEAQREMWRKSLYDVKQAWKQALAGPGGDESKADLSRACRVATKTAKKRFVEFGCKWD